MDQMKARERHLKVFGSLLSSHRNDRTRGEIARALNDDPSIKDYYPKGVTRVNVAHWETGLSYPPRSIDAALCTVYGLDPEQLVFSTSRRKKKVSK